MIFKTTKAKIITLIVCSVLVITTAAFSAWKLVAFAQENPNDAQVQVHAETIADKDDFLKEPNTKDPVPEKKEPEKALHVSANVEDQTVTVTVSYTINDDDAKIPHIPDFPVYIFMQNVDTGIKTVCACNKATGITVLEEVEAGNYTIALYTPNDCILPVPEVIKVENPIIYIANTETAKEIAVEEDDETIAEDGTEASKTGGEEIIISEQNPAPAPSESIVPTPNQSSSSSNTQSTPTPTPTPSATVVPVSTVNGVVTIPVYMASSAKLFTAENGRKYLYYADGTVSPYYIETMAFFGQNVLSKAIYDASFVQTPPDSSSTPSSNDSSGTSSTPSSSSQPSSSSDSSSASTSQPDSVIATTPDSSQENTDAAAYSIEPMMYSIEPMALFDTPIVATPADIIFCKPETNEYFTTDLFQLTTENVTCWYSGWVEESGQKHYYHPTTHTKLVSGVYKIGDEIYTFDASGNIIVEQNSSGSSSSSSSSQSGQTQTSSGTLCIDVSSHQGAIDWPAVYNSGIRYAIIRVAYRGWGTGRLVEDSRAAYNIANARAAGIKVGLYVFDQAVNETEANEEASLAIWYAQRYGCDLGIFIDSEWSGGSPGRGDQINIAQRTADVITFCQTVKNSGYTPGIYASVTWFYNYLDFSRLSAYRIWVAHYTSSPAPNFKYSWWMWQFTSQGKINGITGNVDVNKFA